MNRLKKIAKFCKENPWEAGFYAMSGLFVLQTLNAMRGIKIINEQNDEIEKANVMMGWIAQAIEKGYELVLLEDGLIDILVDKELVIPQNQAAIARKEAHT